VHMLFQTQRWMRSGRRLETGCLSWSSLRPNGAGDCPTFYELGRGSLSRTW